MTNTGTMMYDSFDSLCLHLVQKQPRRKVLQVQQQQKRNIKSVFCVVTAEPEEDINCRNCSSSSSCVSSFCVGEYIFFALPIPMRVWGCRICPTTHCACTKRPLSSLGHFRKARASRVPRMQKLRDSPGGSPGTSFSLSLQ